MLVYVVFLSLVNWSFCRNNYFENESVYTSGRLSELWRGIEVKKTSKMVIDPTPLPQHETIPPPNMPNWTIESTMGYTLPSDFIWGWATSAYQCEGAVDADGRGTSIWDVALHERKNLVTDNSDGDVSANHYYLFKEDAQRMKAMNVSSYSMSISWSRIFPFGNGKVNQAGLQHYIDEIDYLIHLGIQPVITLMHFDMPQELQVEYGGFFSNRIIQDFTHYAEILFDTFGSKVKKWITVNEPYMYCMITGQMFPRNLSDHLFPMHGISRDKAPYLCMHNTILAHASIVKLFRDTVQKQHSDRMITYKDSFYYVEPLTKNLEDIEAADRFIQFNAMWFAKPVLIDGDYPGIMKETLGDLLPKFSPEQKAIVKRSADYFAWDGFCGHPVQAAGGGIRSCIDNKMHKSWPGCYNVSNFEKHGWMIGDSGDLSTPRRFSTPQLFRKGLRFISDTFDPPGGIVISEFGFPRRFEQNMALSDALYDTPRVQYYIDYLKQILAAVNEDKINIIGAWAWSALDDFECVGGYQSRFGLQYVDYKTQKRWFKKSAFVFSDFFRKHVRNHTVS